MTRVSDGDGAVAGDVRGEGGGESAAGAPDQAVVEFPQHDHRVLRVFTRCANGADKHRDKHGGGKTLAGNVADYDEQSAIAVGKNLEEIATDLPSGLVDGLDRIPRKGLALLRQNDLLHLASGGYFVLQRRLVQVHPNMAPTLTDEDKNESCVSQEHGGSRREPIKSKAISKPDNVSGAHPIGLRSVREPVNQKTHDHKLKRKQRKKCFPESTTQSYARGGIGDSEQAGKHDSDCESNPRLQPHIHDVVGKPQRGEDKEHSQEKDNDGLPRCVSPGARGVYGIRSHLLRPRHRTEAYVSPIP